MSSKRKTFVPLAALVVLLAATSAFAQQWELRIPVQHRAQKEDWSCGPNTIAMWAGYIKKVSLDTNQIAKKYTGTGTGTTIPEFTNAMYQLTPYGYVFSEWAYTNQYAAVKSILWSVARFNEPVAIAGNNGGHYYLIVGGVADKNPYLNYKTSNRIYYLYAHDSREDSPLYTNPKTFSSGWWSVHSYPILKRGKRYTPDQVMYNWPAIGAWGDKKYRSVERNTYAAWKSQGATYYNRDVFYSY